MSSNWIKQAKNALIQNEKERIVYRSGVWQNVVNQCTESILTETIPQSFHSTMFNINNIPPFQYQASQQKINEFLSYLISWNGLNMKLTSKSKQPKQYGDYLKKARNWANGCRPKEYAKGFFPNMIIAAEQYAILISKGLVRVDTDEMHTNNNRNMIILFQQLLIYSYLLEALTTRVKVVNSERRVNLISDNSMKTYRSNSNKLCKILQKFATDHEYVHNFPSHRDEAIGYFRNAQQNAIHAIKCEMQKIEMRMNSNSNQMQSPSGILGITALNMIQFIMKQTDTENRKVIIDKDVWNMIQNGIYNAEQKVAENHQHEMELRSQVYNLSVHQTHGDIQPKQDYSTALSMQYPSNHDHNMPPYDDSRNIRENHVEIETSQNNLLSVPDQKIEHEHNPICPFTENNVNSHLDYEMPPYSTSHQSHDEKYHDDSHNYNVGIVHDAPYCQQQNIANFEQSNGYQVNNPMHHHSEDYNHFNQDDPYHYGENMDITMDLNQSQSQQFCDESGMSTCGGHLPINIGIPAGIPSFLRDNSMDYDYSSMIEFNQFDDHTVLSSDSIPAYGPSHGISGQSTAKSCRYSPLSSFQHDHTADTYSIANNTKSCTYPVLPEMEYDDCGSMFMPTIDEDDDFAWTFS